MNNIKIGSLIKLSNFDCQHDKYCIYLGTKTFADKAVANGFEYEVIHVFDIERNGFYKIYAKFFYRYEPTIVVSG